MDVGGAQPAASGPRKRDVFESESGSRAADVASAAGGASGAGVATVAGVASAARVASTAGVASTAAVVATSSDPVRKAEGSDTATGVYSDDRTVDSVAIQDNGASGVAFQFPDTSTLARDVAALEAGLFTDLQDLIARCRRNGLAVPTLSRQQLMPAGVSGILATIASYEAARETETVSISDSDTDNGDASVSHAKPHVNHPAFGHFHANWEGVRSLQPRSHVQCGILQLWSQLCFWHTLTKDTARRAVSRSMWEPSFYDLLRRSKSAALKAKLPLEDAFKCAFWRAHGSSSKAMLYNSRLAFSAIPFNKHWCVMTICNLDSLDFALRSLDSQLRLASGGRWPTELQQHDPHAEPSERQLAVFLSTVSEQSSDAADRGIVPSELTSAAVRGMWMALPADQRPSLKGTVSDQPALLATARSAAPAGKHADSRLSRDSDSPLDMLNAILTRHYLFGLASWLL